MSFVPVVDPQPDIVGQIDNYDAPKRTSYFAGLLNTAKINLQESPTGWASHTIAKYVNDQVAPGKFLTPEIISQKYPNITKKYPKGGYEYDVMLDSQLKDSHNAAIDTVANMPKDYMSKAATFGGSVLGTSLSPTSWIGFGLARKATEFAAKALIGTAITKRLLGRTAVRFGFGTAEGVAAIAPLTAGQQNFYKQMDEEAPPVWSQLIIGGLLGGLLHTAFGNRTTFDPKIMSQALETANDQIATGKNINVEPLLKQAQYEASKTWPETQEEIQSKIGDQKEKLRTLKIDEFQKKLIAGQELAKEINTSANPDGTITLYHGTSKTNANLIMNGERFGKGAFFSVRKGGIEGGDSPLDVAKRKFGKEGTVIKINTDARELESAAAGTEVFSPKALIRDEAGNWRAETIKDESEELQKQIDDTELYQQVHASKPQPPTNEESLETVRSMTQPESDQNYNEKLFNNAEDAIKQPQQQVSGKVADLDETINNLKNNDLLSDNAKSVLEDGEAEQRDHNTLKDALRKYSNCSLGEK